VKNIEQIYTNCLAQGAYFISSNGEAAVIDPLRESFPYIELAKEKNVKIKYIFETHFHADFVSGHIDLAKQTGATIVYGPGAETGYEKHNAKDGEEFKVGELTIRVLHTPGHTPESTTYLLINEEGKEHAIFTGDTLFIGDVGRPDLAQKATNLTKEDLAGWLFDSLRNKIMPLPDEVIVYPAHGAGSSCGKNMSSETWDTLGNQKATNYALRADMSKEEFIKEVTEGLLPPPQYFSKNAILNKKGYGSFDDAIQRGLQPLSIEEFKALQNDKEVLLLDVRDKWDFINGFIPNSMFIGLGGSFAPWVGSLVSDINQKIALIVEPGKEEEAVRRLTRVGYDNAIGYLEGGFEAWKEAGEKVDTIDVVSMDQFINDFENSQRDVIDIRKSTEYETAHLNVAQNLPLDDFLTTNFNTAINKDQNYYLHCRSGFRSTIASSILKKMGYNNFINIVGKFDDMKNSDLEMTGSCPSLSLV